TDEVFRFLVVSQQAVDQFVRDGHLVAIPWECSSFLPIDRLHKSFYTPGLSEDEFMLREAGGATKLLIQASTVRAIGWVFFILPIFLTAIGAIAMKSVFYTLVTGALMGIVCIPFSVYCFKYSAKQRHVAERARTKIC
ncbi:MAG: hypothetical protein Q8K91_05635, partial [Hylemonella sp.]|nr:hypothetical protein [Hylemonella sp.]MDP1936669.1 hypothetical protein [Hylemonella sp.]